MVKKIVSLFVTCLLLVASVSAAQQKVQIQGAVGKLAAVITTPENSADKKIPVVLLFHGFTSSKEDPIMMNLADTLASKEYASIRFDFNGHGESEGEFEKMTVLNEIEDAIRGNTMGATYDSLNPPEKVHIYGKYSIGRDYITTARTLKIYETAQNYTGPVCLIHGTGDIAVAVITK